MLAMHPIFTSPAVPTRWRINDLTIMLLTVQTGVLTVDQPFPVPEKRARRLE